MNIRPGASEASGASGLACTPSLAEDSLAQEVMRMKMAVEALSNVQWIPMTPSWPRLTWTEAATGVPGASMKLDTKEDPAETVLSSDRLRHWT